MNREHQSKEWETWRQIVAKAWQDTGFKKRLLAEPEAVVKEHGLEVPAGVKLRLVERPGQVLELTFLPEGLAGELTEEELSTVTGGGGYSDADGGYGGGGGGDYTVRYPTVRSWGIVW
jgi:nitrile hydratase alpha subunit